MAKQKSSDTPERVGSRKAAASMLGVTDRQLGTWANEAWFPAGGKTAAGWDVAAIRAARDAMGRKGSEHAERSHELKRGLDEEKLNEAKIKNEKIEIALRKEKKELLPRRGWELFAAQLLTQLGDWCDQLPDLIAADVPKKYRGKVKKRIKSELDLKRRELRDELARKAQELDQEIARERARDDR